MRIQANYFSYSPVQKKNTNFRPVQNKVSTPVVDTFTSKNVSFGESISVSNFRVYDRFDPVKASDSELDNMAVIFNNESVEDIEKNIDLRYKNEALISDAESKKQIAKDRLIPRLKKVQEDKRKQLEIVNNLTEKDKNSIHNISAQKLKLTQDYLVPLESKIAGNQDVPVADSILVYGDIDYYKKNDFRKWLFEAASQIGVRAVKVDGYSYNPEKIFKNLNSAIENAKRYNELTGLHSIIFIDDFDRFYADVNQNKALGYVNDFNAMLKNAAKNYHTTFVFQSDDFLENTDSDFIANKGCNLKIELNDGLTQDDKAALKSAKYKLEKYEEKSKQTKNYFGWETFSYDDDIHWGPGDLAYEIGR